MRDPGRFIVLEGIDGSGTTTQVKLLAEALTSQGYDVLQTCEPTDGPVGRLLRSVLAGELLEEAGQPLALDWTALSLLFAADRMDHVRRTIEPALVEGRIVISDRYDLSSLVYQSETSPHPQEALAWLKSLNAQALRPDLTLVLELGAGVAEARRKARGGREELFERSELQQRLAARYRQASEILPEDSVVAIDANTAAGPLSEEIFEQVTDLLGMASKPP